MVFPESPLGAAVTGGSEYATGLDGIVILPSAQKAFDETAEAQNEAVAVTAGTPQVLIPLR